MYMGCASFGCIKDSFEYIMYIYTWDMVLLGVLRTLLGIYIMYIGYGSFECIKDSLG